MTQVPFGQWLPDLPDHQNPGALVAKNCVPEINSYRSLRSLESFSNALADVCLGSTWARASNNDIFNFAGDNSALYSLENGTTWTNIQQVGGYNATRWEFEQFGDRIIATNIGDSPQFYDMNVSALFADLPGSPPNAAHIGVVRDFVVLGNINDGDILPRTVDWSGFNNSEQWTSSQRTQSGRQELRGRGGPIRRIIGGDVGIIFQERSITRMTYVGPPVLFRFDEIERARGAASSDGVVWTGARAFYYSTDGFYSLNLYGGQDSEPIGNNRVNNWFRDNVDPAEIRNMRGAIDRENSLVMWAFKSTGSATQNNRLIIYNWQADRWSYAEVGIQAFAEFASSGLSLDQLDGPFPLGIDLQSISVDSQAFTGGSIDLLVFNGSNEGATFSGTELDVCIDTKEWSQQGAFSFVNEIRPLIEGNGSFSLAALTRDRLIDNPIESLPIEINDNGVCELRVNSRYHRYRLTGSSAFEHASGVEFNPIRRGRR